MSSRVGDRARGKPAVPRERLMSDFIRRIDGRATPSRVAVVVARVAALCLLTATNLGGQAPHAGKATYDKWCAGCHGLTGDGNGPGAAYMLPRPRDFTKGTYQIRTTASGELPTEIGRASCRERVEI